MKEDCSVVLKPGKAQEEEMILDGKNITFAIDREKLLLLAEWFDMQYPNDSNPEVQVDLRRMADRIERLEKDNKYLQESLKRL